MRFVPSLTPPLTVVKEGLKLQALARVKPVKPVQASPPPPLKVQRHARPEASGDHTGQQERRHDAQVHGERRTYCRRIEHLPILVELRSRTDRRRHKQREGDLTEHVDEEVASSTERKEIRGERADQDINASEATRKAMGQEKGAGLITPAIPPHRAHLSCPSRDGF